MELTSEKIKETVGAIIDAGLHQPVMIWGPPGVGKSETIGEIAKERKMGLIDLRLSQVDPVDLRGLPKVDHEKNRTHYTESPLLPHEDIHGETGILFLDEINAAPGSVMAAGYQLVLDRKVGDYELPAGWIVLAAGNRAGDGGITNKMPTPLANRFLHLEFAVCHKTWTKWASKVGIDPSVIAFVNFKPEMFFKAPKRGDEQGFPSPRSWVSVSRLLSKGINNLSLTQGLVGLEAATDFKAFQDLHLNLPDLNEILTNPMKHPVPDQSSTKYAVTAALAYKVDAANIGKAVQFLRDNNEFIDLMRHMVTARDPQLLNNSIMVQWICDNSSVGF